MAAAFSIGAAVGEGAAGVATAPMSATRWSTSVERRTFIFFLKIKIELKETQKAAKSIDLLEISTALYIF